MNAILLGKSSVVLMVVMLICGSCATERGYLPTGALGAAAQGDVLATPIDRGTGARGGTGIDSTVAHGVDADATWDCPGVWDCPPSMHSRVGDSPQNRGQSLDDAEPIGSNEGLSAHARAGLDVVFYKAHLESGVASTPVHPDDTWLLDETTSTQPDTSLGRRADVAPMGGLFATWGSERLRLLGGVYARWNLLHYADGYREGLYSVRQQRSDPRPAWDAAFVFSQVTPGPVSLIPTAGVEGNIGRLKWGAEVGFPLTGWDLRSGHDRYARWDSVETESWRGFGIRYAGTLAFAPTDAHRWFVSGVYERYDCDFGKVDGLGVLIGFTLSW